MVISTKPKSMMEALMTMVSKSSPTKQKSEEIERTSKRMIAIPTTKKREKRRRAGVP